MALNADVFSWGRNIEGQLGDNTTISTFVSAASAYPVAPSGASDNFEIFNAGERTTILRGIDVTVPTSASRWGFARFTTAGTGDDLWEISNDKLHWDGSPFIGDAHTYTWLDSNFKIQPYRWASFDFEVYVDFDLLQFTQPPAVENSIRLYLWQDSAAFAFLSRRITSAGLNEYRLFGTTTGSVTYSTTDTSGKFRFTFIGGILTAYIWNTSLSQWEWNGNPAGYVMSEKPKTVSIRFLVDQHQGGALEVEFDNFTVTSDVSRGNPGVNPAVDTPGHAYWGQPQSALGSISNPFLEFSGDTPGTTANNIQRQYRTYDGSQDTIHPLIEGASAPLFTVAGGNLYFDGITNNPNGAKDLHPLIVFEEDFEIIWVSNIINGPNTSTWGVRLSYLQINDRTTPGGGTVTSFEPEYGYSGARRYRAYVVTGGVTTGWVNGASRTDAQIRIKMTRVNNVLKYYAWYNGIWNLQNPTSGLTQTDPIGPAFFTWRFSNSTPWPGFQADLESLSIVPSGTPDGSFYWADAPMIPSPSGFTDDAALTVGDPEFLDMVGGKNHAIGIKQDGSAHAWGDNQFGQLGDGTLVNKSSPVSVQGNHSFVELAPASDHNLALKEDGSIFTWGRNDFGQLGSLALSGSNQNSPISITGTFITVATGLDHSLAINRSGQVYTWGRNTDGQLGTGDTTNRATPTLVSGLPTEYFIKVTGGAKHSCAMTELGDVWCWGDNTYTQVAPSGYGSQLLTPILVSGGPFIDIDAGGYHNLTLDSEYRLWAWGRNDLGQLGDNSLTDRDSPVSVYGNHIFYDISAGENHSFAIKADGTICTWGAGDWGKLLWHTDENPRSIPICGTLSPTPCVPFLPNTGNYAHSTYMQCGSQFIAWTWGCNTDGKLGDGSVSNKSTPTQVIGNKKWIDMSGGGDFTIAIDTDGHIYAWGDDSKGQLGDG